MSPIKVEDLRQDLKVMLKNSIGLAVRFKDICKIRGLKCRKLPYEILCLWIQKSKLFQITLYLPGAVFRVTNTNKNKPVLKVMVDYTQFRKLLHVVCEKSSMKLSEIKTRLMSVSARSLKICSRKNISLKAAIKKYEDDSGLLLSGQTFVNLNGSHPSIDRLDSSTSYLDKCQRLSLSSNAIEKLNNLTPLRNLKILVVSHNNLKNFNGIECLSNSLVQLWASGNMIEKLSPLSYLKKLQILYMDDCAVKDFSEIYNLVGIPLLTDLSLKGCPLVVVMKAKYRSEIRHVLPQIEKLDGYPW